MQIRVLTPDDARYLLSDLSWRSRRERAVFDRATMVHLVATVSGIKLPTAEVERQIRATCIQAVGQRDKIAREMLRPLLDFPCDVRRIVEDEFPSLIKHLDHVEKFDEDGQQPKPQITNDHNSALTRDEEMRVLEFLAPRGPNGKKPPLLTYLAHKVAGRESPLVDELERVGLQAVERCARSYDPARGAFTTFASLRVKGAMKNYLARDHRPSHFYGYDEVALDYSSTDEADGATSGARERARDDWRMAGKLDPPEAKKTPEKRTSTGAKITAASYIATQTQLREADQLIRSKETAARIETELANLTPNEREAFLNRYMTPELKKLSRGELAHKLGVSTQYVGRLERDAKRKLQRAGIPV